MPTHHTIQARTLLQDPVCLPVKRLCKVSRPQMVRVALKQHQPNRVLQPLHATTQRRLRQPQLPGRRRYTALLIDRHEMAELLQLPHGITFTHGYINHAYSKAGHTLSTLPCSGYHGRDR